jgi:hypothetical protein
VAKIIRKQVEVLPEVADEYEENIELFLSDSEEEKQV